MGPPPGPARRADGSPGPDGGESSGPDGGGTGGFEGGTAGPSEAAPSPSASSPAAAKAEIFGGGREVFPDRRMVALYGTPGNPSLGVLGEQGPAESVRRVKDLAAQYQPYSEEQVIPAFEVITTVASSEPGPDGDYSAKVAPEDLEPLLKEARENGVYVVLDFQPGLESFPDQVARYADQLKDPNVGVGLDPEWRLAPGQVPLQQIGTVSAAEINETLDDVAALTAEEGLPQKLVVLHQFTHSMITERETLDVSHPELALTLHADGHGSPDLKTETWNALQEGLPEGIAMSWKNFYDEDTPMLTPEQTYAVQPKPWVVTYQ
ncbi:sugar phosphate isomerase/epimerase [Rothia sp. AR01]|uniref:Sugar phosphate isomerase/epimerase n=1 Tax=Rothia santali TaxID=2949643 RepID=A0A9X2KLX0_9MICC|nr:sugar phosphate isomerase/epimerase [Rothia santali]MCP3426596.1 sugar phosphate isomerase/epimerase [Rothia santali]